MRCCASHAVASAKSMRCCASHAVASAQSALAISGLRGFRRGAARSLRSRAKKLSFFALLLLILNSTCKNLYASSVAAKPRRRRVPPCARSALNHKAMRCFVAHCSACEQSEHAASAHCSACEQSEHAKSKNGKTISNSFTF